MRTSELSAKYAHLSQKRNDPYIKNQVEVTRALIQGSSAKKDRLQFADPNDHYFNSKERFTNKKTSEYFIDSKDEKQMPAIKHSLPKVSPLNQDEEDELITVIKDIITHERDLEGAKVHLT